MDIKWSLIHSNYDTPVWNLCSGQIGDWEYNCDKWMKLIENNLYLAVSVKSHKKTQKTSGREGEFIILLVQVSRSGF